MPTPIDGQAPADPALVKHLAAVTLALGEAEEAAGPGGYRFAIDCLLQAASMLADRYATAPAAELALAAQRLGRLAAELARHTAPPWPPLVGQSVWLPEMDGPGRVTARNGLLFTVEPQLAGSWPVKLALTEILPLPPIALAADLQRSFVP